MAKIKILGTAAVITSGVKAEVLNTLRKFKPTALKLVDKESKNELFAVSMGSTPQITKFGAVFTNVNEEGYAEMTVQLPTNLDTADKKREFVKDNFGYGLLNLNKLEAQITKVAEETAEEFDTIEEGIETL